MRLNFREILNRLKEPQKPIHKKGEQMPPVSTQTILELQTKGLNRIQNIKIPV